MDNPVTTPRASLRRSCLRCFQAKNTCDRNLPTCTRCHEKRYRCQYLNQPAPGLPQHGATMQSQVQLCQAAVIAPLKQPDCPAFSVALDTKSIQYLIEKMRIMVEDFVVAGTSLPFLHSRLSHNAQTRRLLSVSGQPPGPAAMSSLFGVDALDSSPTRSSQNHNFFSLLRSIHPFMVLQMYFLFHPSPHSRLLAHKRMPLLLRMTYELWSVAPRNLPRGMSAHEAWVLAESVRRTIIMSHLLEIVHSASINGSFIRSPFMEALPFDRRAVLWSLPHDNPFLVYLEGPHPSLVSLSEYLREWDQGKVHGARMFETLLLVAIRGKTVVEERIALEDVI